jgi:transcriptional regulator
VYVPRHFDASDPAACHALMRAESFATLVTTDGHGVPFATHVPFLLDPDRGPRGTLRAHMARANPHWQEFAAGREALVVFLGPHAYVSPGWYVQHPSVPTWNYVAVHAYGIPVVVDDPARVRAFLAELTETYEAGRPAPWSIDGLPADYLAGMQRGIVAFEIPISRLEGKAKLSQNRGAEDRARVEAALAATGDPWSRATAARMAAARAAAQETP